MKVLIADDHPLVRSGVRGTLSRSDECDIVGEAQDAKETLKLVEQLKPDLLILDLDMPGGPPEELAQSVRQVHPGLKILVLTAHNDDKILRRLTKVSISGYLLKDEAPENLLQAVRTIGQGAAWFSQAVAQRLLNLHQQEDPVPSLTPRERQILGLISQGKDNQSIAQQLALAEQTVRNYASVIYDKIGVASRVEAVVWARQQGLYQEA